MEELGYGQAPELESAGALSFGQFTAGALGSVVFRHRPCSRYAIHFGPR
jgi:hypothetical protein